MRKKSLKLGPFELEIVEVELDSPTRALLIGAPLDELVARDLLGRVIMGDDGLPEFDPDKVRRYCAAVDLGAEDPEP